MSEFFDLHANNVRRGRFYQEERALSLEPVKDYPVKFIAYYLPQFHESAENNEWWGAGFTEWTNTTKAVPRFSGHYQPRLPADLGFYDLADIDTLRRQVELARRGGVYGFCIHHYWFSGRSVLEKPLRILLDHPGIDMPFFLNWANENWTRRWDGLENEILIEQRYEVGDNEAYVESIIEAVRDRRYIHLDGRPLLMIYRPDLIPNVVEWVNQWRDQFKIHNLGDPFLVLPQGLGRPNPREYGMDGVAGFPPHGGGWELPRINGSFRLFDSAFRGRIMSYDALAALNKNRGTFDFPFFPGVCPQWDNEARKPGKGVSFFGSTPAKFGEWLRHAGARAKQAINPAERLVFINAWNEWAEGAYLEPDQHFGFAYLVETRKALDSLTDASRPEGQQEEQLQLQEERHAAGKIRLWHQLRDLWRRSGNRLRRRLPFLFDDCKRL